MKFTDKNFLSKIALIAFSLVFSLGLAKFSSAQATPIRGTFGVTASTATTVSISGNFTNSPSELKQSAIKLSLGDASGGHLADSGFISVDSAGNFQVGFSGLTPATAYTFYFFDTAGHLSPSPTSTFKTSPNPSITAVLDSQAVSDTSVKIVGKISYPAFPMSPENLKNIQFVIQYGVNPKPSKDLFENSSPSLQFDKDGNFTQTLSGLKAATDYQYRVYDSSGALNPSVPADFSTGGERQVIAGSQVANVDATTVKISGQISNKSKPVNTLQFFIQYGLASGSMDRQSANFTTDAVGNFSGVTISGLQPGTPYQYRIVDSTETFDPSDAGSFITLASNNSFPSGGGTGGAGGVLITPPGNPASSSSIGGLENPIHVNTLMEFVEKILNIVVTIGIPIIAIFIIYAGFLFVTARGDSGKLNTAKDTLLWTIVGAAVILGSWILAKAVCQTVSEIGNTLSQCQ
jgi:hypothetical protein